jgi:hypothetical protein
MATVNTAREATPILAGIMSEQRCIHAVMGRAPGTKMCANNYHCGNCEYDQMLEDTVRSEVRPTRTVRALERAA